MNKTEEVLENIEFFSKDEFTCKCGCGLNLVDYRFIQRLDFARRYAKVPFILNSATRCSVHNLLVSGSEDSSHLKGLAIDIKCTNSIDRFKILNSLMDEGFTRIGVYENFIHVDIDDSKTQNVVWYV